MAALTLLRNGESLANLKRAGHKQIHYWHKSYAVLVVSGENDESPILVSRLKTHIGVVDIPLDSVQQIEYIKKVLQELLVIHSDDHSKGHTLHGRICKIYANIVWFTRHLLTPVLVVLSNNSIYVHWLDCIRL